MGDVASVTGRVCCPEYMHRGGVRGLFLPRPMEREDDTMTTLPPKQEDPRYAPIRQYSLAQILAVWAAAAIPMAVLAWLVAPLLGALLGGGGIRSLRPCCCASPPGSSGSSF